MMRTGKRFIAMFVMCVLMVSSMAVTSFAGQKAIDEELGTLISTQKIILEDGTELIETVYKKQGEISLFSGNQTATYTKKWVSGNNSNAYAKLTATFSYNIQNKEVSCISKYSSGTLNSYKEKSLTNTSKGRTCSVTLKFSFLSMAGTSNQSLKMTCDYNGDLQ